MKQSGDSKFRVTTKRTLCNIFMKNTIFVYCLYKAIFLKNLYYSNNELVYEFTKESLLSLSCNNVNLNTKLCYAKCYNV